jgi:Fe-S-cluster-containing dehydrogenase component
MTVVGETTSKSVMLDLDRCIECGSCAAACYVSHGNMPAIDFAGAGWALLPVLCRQCVDPACVDVCPADAMVRDADGIVRRRLVLCIGCGSCARACPFGVLETAMHGVPSGYGSTERLNGHQVAKCDLCADRTIHDGGAPPRCVAACPTNALMFIDPQETEDAGVVMLGGRTAGQDLYKRR